MYHTLLIFFILRVKKFIQVSPSIQNERKNQEWYSQILSKKRDSNAVNNSNAKAPQNNLFTSLTSPLSYHQGLIYYLQGLVASALAQTVFDLESKNLMSQLVKAF